MADYNGLLTDTIVADKRMAKEPGMTRFPGRAKITTEKPFGGTHSLEVQSGAVHDVYYGADAGSRTITARVWPPVGGTCFMQLLTREHNRIATVWNTGGGAWEQLSITEVLTKGVYILRVGNTTKPNGDVRAWFDDVG